MNDEWLLAFETEQAKRNTKHSSERTVITHKPVSALLEGLLFCVNDLSCLWHAALWIGVGLLQLHVIRRRGEENKDLIYGCFHKRLLSKTTFITLSIKLLISVLFTFSTL